MSALHKNPHAVKRTNDNKTSTTLTHTRANIVVPSLNFASAMCVCSSVATGNVYGFTKLRIRRNQVKLSNVYDADGSHRQSALSVEITWQHQFIMNSIDICGFYPSHALLNPLIERTECKVFGIFRWSTTWHATTLCTSLRTGYHSTPVGHWDEAMHRGRQSIERERESGEVGGGVSALDTNFTMFIVPCWTEECHWSRPYRVLFIFRSDMNVADKRFRHFKPIWRSTDNASLLTLRNIFVSFRFLSHFNLIRCGGWLVRLVCLVRFRRAKMPNFRSFVNHQSNQNTCGRAYTHIRKRARCRVAKRRLAYVQVKYMYYIGFSAGARIPLTIPNWIKNAYSAADERIFRHPISGQNNYDCILVLFVVLARSSVILHPVRLRSFSFNNFTFLVQLRLVWGVTFFSIFRLPNFNDDDRCGRWWCCLMFFV